MVRKIKQLKLARGFTKEWFVDNQSILLWFLNTPYIKRWFRWVLGINIKTQIIEIGTNFFKHTPHRKLVRIFYRKDGTFEIYEGKHLDYSLRQLHRLGFIEAKYQYIDLNLDRMYAYQGKFAVRLYYSFKWVWWAIHFWDILIANQLQPAWNFGFDVLPFYSTTGAGGTTGDAMVVRVGATGEGFSGMRTGAGTAVYNSDFSLISTWYHDASETDHYRFIISVDSSSLGSGVTITGATWNLYAKSKSTGLGAIVVHVCQSTHSVSYNWPASDYDYTKFGTTSYGSLAASSTTTSAYNVITLNSTGYADISKTGITRHGFRDHWDLNNDSTGLTLAGVNDTAITFASTDTASNDKDPYLEVTYTPAVTTQTKTVSALARIKIAGNDKTVSAKARIKQINITKTVSSKARILIAGNDKTVSAKARIKATLTKTVSAKARIKIVGNDKTVSAKARVKVLGNDKTVSAKARVKVLGNDKTISAKAQITGTLTKTISAKADIAKFGVTQTISAKARIKIADITNTVSAKALILVVNTKTLSAKGRIQVLESPKTVSAKARILTEAVTKTVSAKARILVVGITQTITAKARIAVNVTQTISAKARIFAFPIGIILGLNKDTGVGIGQRDPVMVGLNKDTGVGIGIRLIK